ncbi:MAG: hypothetical protein QOG21_87 [Actinomycetota bacterium]|nr:hypothetical protein [Actinomycetota bacterium]
MVRPRGKTPVLKLDPQERDLLRQLLTEMRTLLEADLPRVDDVTRRLFPDAFDDPQEAAKFRELVGDELRADKLAALEAVDEQLAENGSGEVSLGPAKVQGLLSLLTDMRLAIGTRLGVTEETMQTELDPSDPEAPALSMLHWLGWMQETVLSEINGRGGRWRWS